jgi:hypothetical protein
MVNRIIRSLAIGKHTMKALRSLAFVASASALLMASSAYASTDIDGVISPDEYKNAIVTSTPYAPGADTSLNTFGNGNENVATTTYFQADPNGKGFDVAIQTNPAGAGMDNADASVGDQFANLYFGDPVNTSYIGFELGNSRAFEPGVPGYVDYTTASSGILYADTPGMTYANGGTPSTIEAHIPYATYETLAAEFGVTGVGPGSTIQFRDEQAFSFAGNNAGGGARFGSIIIPSAVPEPNTWAMMLLGMGMLGFLLRRKREASTATPAAIA